MWPICTWKGNSSLQFITCYLKIWRREERCWGGNECLFFSLATWHGAYGILVPQPEIKPCPLKSKCSLNHWTSRKSSVNALYIKNVRGQNSTMRFCGFMWFVDWSVDWWKTYPVVISEKKTEVRINLTASVQKWNCQGQPSISPWK